MKYKQYKIFVTIFLVFNASIYGQTTEKKFSEIFNCNKDVEIEINASNTDINVTTWNKNEVKVEAFIEIEGLNKEEAKKYFEKYPFEVMGNSKKVIINTNRKSFGKSYFVVDNNFSIPLPELPEIPEIVIPEIPEIELPDIDFDAFCYTEIFTDLDKIIKEGKFIGEWSFDDEKIIIKSKEDWEKFKKSDKYNKLKEKLAKEKDKMYKDLKKRTIELKKAIEEQSKAKKEVIVIRNQQIKEQKEAVKRRSKETRKTVYGFRSNFNNENGAVIINGKKIKIKKRIEIKVPKEATFNLNTKHCKIKLPNTVAYGNVKYGTFSANDLTDCNLTISYSPTTINDLKKSSLFLKNVTDAQIASVANSSLLSSSSGLTINKIKDNVSVSHKFGKIVIEDFDPDFKNFTISLNAADAEIAIKDTKSCSFDFTMKRTNLTNELPNKLFKTSQNNPIDTHVTVLDKTSKNRFELYSEYSNILLK